MRFNHYYADKTFADTNPGWYTHYGTTKLKYAQIVEILEWLYTGIDNCERHARWEVTVAGHFNIKFRHDRDFMIYKLKWA